MQILNRVTWDNIIIPTEPERARLEGHGPHQPARGHHRRPAADHSPGPVGGAQRHPQHEPDGCRRAPRSCSTTSTRRQPHDAITNQLVNFGWEYVWHCHILTHEEMDMMRPQTLALPPVAPSGLTNTLQPRDGHEPQGRADVERQLHHRDGVRGPAVHQPRQHLDQHRRPSTRRSTSPTSTRRGRSPTRRRSTPTTTVRYYRVVAQNTVGYGQGFPTMTVQSLSNVARRRPELHHHGHRGRQRHHLAARRGGRGQGRQPDVHGHPERRLPHQHRARGRRLRPR